MFSTTRFFSICEYVSFSVFFLITIVCDGIHQTSHPRVRGGSPGVPRGGGEWRGQMKETRN